LSQVKEHNVKTSIGQIRRADLTKAAYYVMLEHGLEGTTVARVGEKAGMSHGIVNYHFKNKMELIHAVVKYANRLIGDKVAELMREAKTPRTKLTAVLKGNFDPSIFTRENARAWLMLYGQTSPSEPFLRLQRLIYSRLQSNLLYNLKALMPKESALVASQGLAVMMDGFWLQKAMEDREITSELAIHLCDLYINAMLAQSPLPQESQA